MELIFKLFYLITLFNFVLTANGIKITWNAKEDINRIESIRKRRSLDESKDNDSTKHDIKLQTDDDHLNKIEIHAFPLKDNRNDDLQLFWLGEKSETQFLLTTMELQFFFMKTTKPSILYQSDDFGESFENIQKKISNTHIRRNHGILKSPINKNKLILVSYEADGFEGSIAAAFSGKEENSRLVITEDGGDTFKKVDIPFVMREASIEFHPIKDDWLIALEKQKTVISIFHNKKYGQAWISKDFGKTWKAMMPGYIAESVKWGATKNEDDIYLATHKHSSNAGFSIFSMFESSLKLTLWKSHDGGRFFEEIIEHLYNFGVQGNFIYASVDFKEKNGQRTKEKRILHVSTDNGNHFHAVKVPEISSDMFYAVVEMYKGTMFLHVDEMGDTGKGTLFVSGADGIMYTKSLENHFYANSGFTDFFRVESMKGVYITQQLNSDRTLKTVITFNRGNTWQPIYISKDYCKGKKNPSVCTLHIHNEFSQIKHFQHQTPVTSENAPGIILAHGQAGDALTGAGNVWFSRNGGYNWTRIAKGSHHYAIGDNGNLIVLVPKFNSTGKTLIYSLNQGRNWYHNEFDLFDENITIHGLAAEPHSKERSFSLWGHRLVKGKKLWHTFTVNFRKLITKECQEEDMKTWYPHINNGKDGCFLGERTIYKVPHKDSLCYLGRSYKPEKKVEKCSCTKDDLECDYGYERNRAGNCHRNEDIPLIEICKNGEEMQEAFSKGYRRVPGDNCIAQSSNDEVVRFIDEHKKCVPNKEDIFGDFNRERAEVIREEEEEKEKKMDETQKATKTKKSKKKGPNWPVIILSIILMCIIIGGAYWYWRKNYRPNNVHHVMYNASSFDNVGMDNNDGDVDADDLFDPRPKSLREYHDETDAEDEQLLLP